MNTKAIILFLTLFTLGIISNGSAQVIVKVKPKTPKSISKRPVNVRHGYVWIPGHWKWSKKTKAYVWIKGRSVKAKRGHRWVSGHWKSTPNGHKWIPGHWKRK